MANASSPYLATKIKELTTDPTTGEVNKATNAMAHAVLGAVVAELNNQSAAAGGLGAGGGELSAQVIMKTLFPNKEVWELSESEKQQVSALSQLASGLAGGLTTGDVAGAVTGSQAAKNAVENNAISGSFVGRTDEQIKETAKILVDGVDLEKLYGDDKEKIDAYRKGSVEGRKEGLKDGVVEVLEGTANSIAHPIDTVTDLATAIWNYDQTFDAVRVSATQWNELYEYALANDPKLAGQMSGALQGKILGNAGTSVVVSGAMAKTLQKAAQLKSGIGKPPPTATSPSGTKHPLLDDAIPRNGDRPVVNQGALPTCGHNSCGMVLDTMGKPVNIVGLINKTPPTPGGITSMQVAGILKSEGVEASAWAGRKVSDISRYTSNGTPIVVRIIDKNGGSGFSHFVVVDGVTSRNGIPVVAIRDPWGKQYFSPVTTFERNFTGEVIVPKGWQK